MRNLNALLLAVAMSANASAGYPVFGLLRSNVYRIPGYGTGFTIEYKGRFYVITNWHVCRYFREANATNEKNHSSVLAKVLRSFPDEDLCVMTSTPRHGLSLGEDVGTQASVYAGGYPEYASTLQLRSGHTISEGDETIDYGEGYCPKGFSRGAHLDETGKKTVASCEHTQRIMDTDLEGTLGNSGSPVVNSRGEVVGVVHSASFGEPKDDHHNTLNFIPVSVLRKVLDSLKP